MLRVTLESLQFFRNYNYGYSNVKSEKSRNGRIFCPAHHMEHECLFIRKKLQGNRVRGISNVMQRIHLH